MPKILTAYFGELDFEDSAVFQFPYGLPGFEAEHSFLFVQQPQTEPLMFLQSLTTSALCFVLLPILVADPEYIINLDAEDLAALHLNASRQPHIGDEILCAAIVHAGEGDQAPTANLMAPLVVNLKEKLGAQVIQANSPYSHQHPLLHGELTPC